MINIYETYVHDIDTIYGHTHKFIYSLNGTGRTLLAIVLSQNS